MRTDAVTFDNDALMGVMSAIMEFNPLLVETAAERKGCPADDLISVWAGVDMDPMTMMHETGLFIAGGAETTRTVIARGLAVLAEHPDQWEAAAADPTLVPGLVEEVIRWVTPLNNMFRTVLTDDHIGEQPVQAGDRVMLAYPSANRDEAVFDEPFRFDIRARPEPARRLRSGHPLLRRRQPGPPRAAPALRRAHPASGRTCGCSPRPTSSPTSSPAPSAPSTSPSTSAERIDGRLQASPGPLRITDAAPSRPARLRPSANSRWITVSCRSRAMRSRSSATATHLFGLAQRVLALAQLRLRRRGGQ